MQSNTIGELAGALAKAQAEMQPAQMNSTNPFFKNRYADLGSIIEAARQPMAKHGLSFTQFAQGDGSTISVETLLMHQSGEWVSSSMSLPLGDEKGRSLAQGAGSIITYLRRYGLAAMLGVYADEDTDGNDGEKGSSTHATTRQPTPTETAHKTAQAQDSAPVCPKCGGAMWDNREGKKNPKAPDFKCKDKSCDGAIWPPRDTGNGSAPDAEFDAMQGAAQTLKAQPEQVQRLGILVKKLYPTEADMESFRTWMKGKYNVDSRKDLTVAQATECIKSLEAAEMEARRN